jgi:hypothetical protein
MAQRESKRAQTSTSILRQREEYRGLGGPEELHHQQVKKKETRFFRIFLLQMFMSCCRLVEHGGENLI